MILAFGVSSRAYPVDRLQTSWSLSSSEDHQADATSPGVVTYLMPPLWSLSSMQLCIQGSPIKKAYSKANRRLEDNNQIWWIQNIHRLCLYSTFLPYTFQRTSVRQSWSSHFLTYWIEIAPFSIVWKRPTFYNLSFLTLSYFASLIFDSIWATGLLNLRFLSILEPSLLVWLDPFCPYSSMLRLFYILDSLTLISIDEK